jgi:hypothetical protein
VAESGVDILLSPNPLVQQHALHEIANIYGRKPIFPEAQRKISQGLLGTALGAVEQAKQ